MHQNRSLSTLLTEFDHFQKRVFGRLISWHLLRWCHSETERVFSTEKASVDQSFTLLGGGRAGYKGDYNSRGWQEFYFSSIWSRLHKEEKGRSGTKGDSLEPRWICLPAEEHMTQLGSRTRFQSILIDLTKVALDHDLTLSSCQQYTNKRSQNRVKLWLKGIWVWDSTWFASFWEQGKGRWWCILPETFLCHWSDLPPIDWERALKLHKGPPVTTNSCLSARFTLILICLLHQQAQWRSFFLWRILFWWLCRVSKLDQKSEKLSSDCWWLMRASLVDGRTLFTEQTKVHLLQFFSICILAEGDKHW